MSLSKEDLKVMAEGLHKYFKEVYGVDADFTDFVEDEYKVTSIIYDADFNFRYDGSMTKDYIVGRYRVIKKTKDPDTGRKHRRTVGDVWMIHKIDHEEGKVKLVDYNVIIFKVGMPEAEKMLKEVEKCLESRKPVK
jgi:hypothetical protein